MNTFRKLVLAMTVLFAGVASVLPAYGQFTGLTPTSSPGLNVRHPLTTDQAILFPQDREMKLMAGDLLVIAVYGVEPAYLDTERVALDGTVRINLGGVVHVADLSLKEAELALAKRFEDAGMFNNAQVSVEVQEAPGHIATIIGDMRGTVPIVGYRRLFDVLAAAGGLPITASTVLTIDRPGVAEQITVDVGNDPSHNVAGSIPIFAGDTITVGRVGVYYVVGAVNRPGVTPLTGSSPVTALQALATGGGATFAAELDDAKLVRTTGTQRSVIELHLKKIEKGHEPDPVLQSDDIIMVPSSLFKAVIRSGGLVSAVAIAISLSTVFR